MDRLRRGLSFRKKKDKMPESSKPHQWVEDERKVREGTCSFQVRYLGCIEVFESRGMQVCEDAVKALKHKQNRSVWSRMSMRKKKRKEKEQAKGKYQRAVLYVSGDALRVVDEISKGLIVDQTIEKVSFCAPDRNHEKGFAYICRDGTTRRWMCHGFLALKESGERLSHAVGCAFAICLEKKQKREKDAVSVQFNDKGTSFARTGSFRQTTLTERLADPQSSIVAEPVPLKEVVLPHKVDRPHATPAMLERQGSFRLFNKIADSPFKRQLSLRLDELPSTLDRKGALNQSNGGTQHIGPAASPIPEVSPTKENPDSIAEMCQQLTAGLSAMTTESPASNIGYPSNHEATVPTQHTPIPVQSHQSPITPPITTMSGYTATVQGRSIPLPAPIRQDNPWGADEPPSGQAANASKAELWLANMHTTVRRDSVDQSMTNGTRAPMLGSHIRSHSIDTSDVWHGQQRHPTLSELANKGQIANFTSQQMNQPIHDPFDAAWASTPPRQPVSNPFQTDKITQSFEVKL